MGNSVSSDDEVYRKRRPNTAPHEPRRTASNIRHRQQRSPSPPPSQFTRNSPPNARRPVTRQRSSSYHHSRSPPSRSPSTSYHRSPSSPGARRQSYTPPRQSPRSAPSPRVTYVEDKQLKPMTRPRGPMNTYDEFDEHGHRIKPREPTSAGNRPLTNANANASYYDEPRDQVVYVRQTGNPEEERNSVEERRRAAQRIREYREKNQQNRPETAGTPQLRVTTAPDKPRQPINYEMRKVQQKPKNDPQKDYLHPNYVPSDVEDYDDYDDNRGNQQQDVDMAEYEETSFEVPPQTAGTHDDDADTLPSYVQQRPPTRTGTGASPSNTPTSRISQAPHAGTWIHAKGKQPNGDDTKPMWERSSEDRMYKPRTAGGSNKYASNGREKTVHGRRVVSNKKTPPPRQWQTTGDPSKKTPKWHSDFLTDDYY